MTPEGTDGTEAGDLHGPVDAGRSPRRVLVVEATGACEGGAQMMLDELLHRADPARYRLQFAGLSAGPWPERLRDEGFPVHVVPKTRWRDVRNVASVAGSLARIVREEHIDLVHASGSDSLLFASLGARRADVPCVWNVFDPLVGLSPRRLLTARRQVTARMLAALRPDAVIFGTARAGDRTPVRRGTPTATILPGIDLARHGHGVGDRARQELGIPAGVPVLATFGRLTFLKSQTDFVRVMAAVTREFPDAYGVICGGEGEADYGDRVRTLRHALGLEDRVLMTGFVPDRLKDDLMAAADVVVHLARRESFGLVVVEAQAAGRTIVAADASGPRSLIDDGVTGVLVPVGDVDRLAVVLLDLLRHPERRVALGEQGRADSPRHGIGPMVEQIESVWDLALDARPGSPDR